MREIKFRAFLSSENRMLSWGELCDGTEDLQTYLDHKLSDVSEVMQFTGLRDKNGREIYEGDILSDTTPPKKGFQTSFGVVHVLFGEYDDSEIEYGSSGVGWYVEGYYGYRRIGGAMDRYNIGGEEAQWSIDRVTDWEVIGNIHEHKELLK